MRRLGRTSRTIWFSEAVKAYYPPAEEALANLYNLGLGVEQSQEKAYAWTKLAAKSGNPEALNKLPILSASLSAVDKESAEEEVAKIPVKSSASKQ